MADPKPATSAAEADGVVTVAPDGTVRDCDRAFARHLGRPREQIVGRRLRDLLAPDAEALREREQLLDQVESLVVSLQEAIEARDEFLSVASHELKTPLTALQLLVEGLLRAGARGSLQLSPALGEKLVAIGRQGRRLSLLVNDLLDVSRIRAGRMDLKLEPVDLAQVAREAAERFGPEAAQGGCELRVSDEGPVVGPWDRLRLEQVAGNLLSNAIKYGAGRPVELRVRRDGRWGLLSVADRGIGVALQEQERIFDRFERAVPARHFGGLGLGLWIAREIVTRLGGSIWVESQPDQGATFTVRLPLAEKGSDVEPGASP
jgi:signal transduction histidine kinase